MTHNEEVKNFINSTFYSNIDVSSFEDLLEQLLNKYKNSKEQVNKLEERVKELSDIHWKDKELQDMKILVEEMKERYKCGFPMTKEENDNIYNWKNEHEAIYHPHTKSNEPRGGAIGGCYSYIFTPTSIGIIGEIQCTCGQKYTFRDL